MLNPLQIQNLQSSTGKALPAAELVRALPLNAPVAIAVKQSAPTPNQAGQFTLQVQVGSKLFQLNSHQNLPAGTQATLTRTTTGQLLLTPTQLPAQPGTANAPASGTALQAATGQPQLLPNQPATTQQRPIQPSAGAQPLPGQSQTTTQQSVQTSPLNPPQSAPSAQQITQTAVPPVNRQPQQQTPQQHSQQAPQQPPATQRQATDSAALPAPSGNRSVADQPLPGRPPGATTATPAQTQSTVVATLQTRPAGLNELLPINRPVLGTISPLVTQATAPPGQHPVSATINGTTVQLNLSQPLAFDGKVLLIRDNARQITLQPLTSPAQNQALQPTINSALRHVLPAQRTVAESLQQIQTLSTSSGADRQAISGILSALINLFGIKPDGTGESRSSIMQNLQNGGLFTERNLANPAKPDLSQDFKHQLNQLLKQADKMPEQPRQQLQELVQGLLSRVTSHQLESLQNTRVSNDGGIERFFALDLPIRHKDQLDNVELKISEHRRQTGDNEWQRLWKVRLHFDLQEMGTVDAELVLEYDYQVTAHFWCSKAETAQQFDEALPEFNQKLGQQGYIINAVHCSEGSAPKPTNSVEQLIDVTT